MGGPPVTFANALLAADASRGNKTASSDARDRGEIVRTLNRWFGSALLHEITALRIESFKRERLAGA